jgi:hypothetical protein
VSNGAGRPWYSYLAELLVILLVRKFVPKGSRFRVQTELADDKEQTPLK